MEKLNAVVLSEDMDLRIYLKNHLKSDNIITAGYSDFSSAGKLKVESLFPDIVICAIRGEVEERIFSFVQQILINLRNCFVVIVNDSITVELVNKAAQFGIRGVIPFTMSEEDLVKELLNIYDLELQRRLDTNDGKKIRSKVLAFFSGKGGTGKTTLAVNTAAQIAKLGKRTILLDLDLNFGNVTMALDLNPRDSIVELVQDRNGVTIENINGFCATHNTGLSVLGAPKSPEYAEYIKPDDIEKIIDTVRPYFEYIILDLPPDLSDATLTALENSEEIFMVYNMDIFSLQNAKSCVDVLRQLHQGDKLKLLVNKFSKGLLNEKDFVKTLEMPVYAYIREDVKLVCASVNKGVPVMLSNPQSEIARDIKSFVGSVIERYEGIKTLNDENNAKKGGIKFAKKPPVKNDANNENKKDNKKDNKKETKKR